jgi:divalent metal cation (Fe/Co/Zn/Cd) transporter
MLDPIVAILVALWITRAAYEITREALGHLLDVALPVEEQQQIIQLVESYYPKALSIHDLRTRRSGSDRYIDLHLVVARDTPVEEAHNLCDQLEARIDEMLPGTNVLIHLEPGDPPGKNESI